MKRVVITGYGILNALGKNATEVERRLFGGESGLGSIVYSSVDGDHKGTVGEIKDLYEVDPFFEENGIPYDRCIQLAIMASQECLEHARIDYKSEDPYRRGVAMGTCFGGMLSGQIFHRQWLFEGIDRADKDYLYLYPMHSAVDVIAKKYNFKGVKNIISTACAASGNIIGYGSDVIKSGKHDLMLVGGADPLCVFSFAGFGSLKALDEEPCKPYSKSQGINLGEGSAFVLLEEYEHAKERNAKIYAEVLGYGLSADAYHPTAPDLGGGGASRAINTAIYMSGIRKEDVSYVNGHGTGTPANDKAERAALKTVFADRVPEVPMSSIKGAIGHCLGAAGAQECVASVMAINSGLIPPTVNFAEDDKSNINFVPNTAQKHDCDIVLSNSFAFGGNNCCLVLGRESAGRDLPDEQDKKIVITGMGCCGVGGENITQLWDTFANRSVHIAEYSSDISRCNQMGVMPKMDWKKYIPGKVIRRIDDVTKLVMTSGKQALEHSKLTVTKDNAERIGVIYSTGIGPLCTTITIDKNIAQRGIGSISLSDFPNSVVNAAPGNFCIANMLKGATSTLSSGAASYLIAINYASQLLKSNMADAIIVVGADECSDALAMGYDKLGLLSVAQFSPFSKSADGMVPSPGAVAVMLESEDRALERGADIYAALKGYSYTSDNYQLCKVSPEGEELYECVKRAVEDGTSGKIDLYINSALGIPDCDSADINALKRLISEGIFDKDIDCSMISPMLGVVFGTNSGYGLLGALYSLIYQEVIGVPENYGDLKDDIAAYYCGKNKKKSINNICISTMALGGSYSSLVLEKY